MNGGRGLMAAGALAAATGLVAAVAAATWPIGTEREPVSPEAPRDDPPEVRLPGSVHASIAPVVDRNLFTADRRPPPERPAAADAPEANDRQGTEALELRLVGVLIGSTRSLVVRGIPGVDGDRVFVVGDTIAGHLIAAIAAGEVMLVHGRDTLHLPLEETQ